MNQATCRGCAADRGRPARTPALALALLLSVATGLTGCTRAATTTSAPSTSVASTAAISSSLTPDAAATTGATTPAPGGCVPTATAGSGSSTPVGTTDDTTDAADVATSQETEAALAVPLPPGHRWVELRRSCRRFAVPDDWTVFRPKIDLAKAAETTLSEMARRSGISLDALVKSLSTMDVYSYGPGAPAPNAGLITAAAAELPSQEQLVKALTDNGATGVTTSSLSPILTPAGRGIIAPYTITRSGRAVPSALLVVDVGDEIDYVTITAPTAAAVAELTEDISATFSAMT